MESSLARVAFSRELAITKCLFFILCAVKGICERFCSMRAKQPAINKSKEVAGENFPCDLIREDKALVIMS